MKRTLFTLLSIAALCAADSAVAQQGRRGRRAAAQTGGGRRAAAPAVQGRRGRGVVPVRQMPVYRAPVVQETVFQEEVVAQPMPTKQGYWDRAKGWISRNPKTAAGIGAGIVGAGLAGGAAAYATTEDALFKFYQAKIQTTNKSNVAALDALNNKIQANPKLTSGSKYALKKEILKKWN